MPRALRVLMLPKALMLVLMVLTPRLVAAQVAAPLPAAAYVGGTVSSVTVTIEGRPNSEPGLLGGIQTAVGRPLAMTDVRETMTHLYSLGRFADVQVEADREANGERIDA